MDADDDVLQVCQMRPPKVTKATLGGIIQLTATRLRKRRIATYAPVARARYTHTILVSPAPSSCAQLDNDPLFCPPCEEAEEDPDTVNMAANENIEPNDLKITLTCLEQEITSSQPTIPSCSTHPGSESCTCATCACHNMHMIASHTSAEKKS